jgi:arabinofuranan 3-O-arabinosyltransferase
MISWTGNRRIGEIVLKPVDGLAAAPTGVLVGSPAGDRLVPVGLGGVVKLSPPLRTSTLHLQFSSLSASAAGNTAGGQPAQLPVGLSAISIPALRSLRPSLLAASTPFALGCGRGPSVSVDGQQYQTSVTGTVGELTQLKPVRLQLCAPGQQLTLLAGQHRLTTAPAADFTVTSLNLSSSAAAAAPPASGRQLRVLSWQADSRRLDIGPGEASYVEVHENFNPGWQATLNGKALTATRLDGWQQAFLVPAGQGGTITLTFGPATAYHAGIVVSVLGLLALLAVAIRTHRRRRARPGQPPYEWFGPASSPPSQRPRDDLPAPAVRARRGMPADEWRGPASPPWSQPRRDRPASDATWPPSGQRSRPSWTAAHSSSTGQWTRVASAQAHRGGQHQAGRHRRSDTPAGGWPARPGPAEMPPSYGRTDTPARGWPARPGPAEMPPSYGRAETPARGWRPRPDPAGVSPSSSAALRRNALLLLPLLVVMAVAGGPIVLVVPLLAIVAAFRPGWLPGIAVAAMLFVGVIAASATNPTALGSGTFSGPAQVCALIALAAALMPAAVSRRASPSSDSRRSR